MALTHKAVSQAKPRDKDYKLFDGKGMYLLVKSSGAKYWRLKYRFAGREKTLALGVYGSVSLAEARGKVDDARRLLRENIDPCEEKQLQKKKLQSPSEDLFINIAEEWLEKQSDRWSEVHSKRVKQSLERDIYPYLGDKSVPSITPPEVLAVLHRVENRGALDVASRLLQRCTAIFRYAIQSGRATINPAVELTGALKTRKVKHRNSLPLSELPSFFNALKSYEGQPTTRLALQLLTLTFVRPGELRGAQWDEFDLKSALWRIPAERMKMKTEHLVPLSVQALAVLHELQPLTGKYDYLFPNERTVLKPISENTLIYALYRMGYKHRATPHGFRATASSILNENGFTPDAIERQLSHLERNKIRGAYTHHAEYLEERREIMNWWGDFIETHSQQIY